MINNKTITETFTICFNERDKLHITARNYNSHLICINGESDKPITVDEMHKLANFLDEVANTIDNDKDFKK